MPIAILEKLAMLSITISKEFVLAFYLNPLGYSDF
jgi:hypothetical protein